MVDGDVLIRISSISIELLPQFGNPLRGSLVENFIIMDCIKNNFNLRLGNEFYYWRDNNVIEIDLIKQNGEKIIPIEIKSAQTYTKDFSKNLKKFISYSGVKEGLILYDGPQSLKGSDGVEVMNWKTYLLQGR